MIKPYNLYFFFILVLLLNTKVIRAKIPGIDKLTFPSLPIRVPTQTLQGKGHILLTKRGVGEVAREIETDSTPTDHNAWVSKMEIKRTKYLFAFHLSDDGRTIRMFAFLDRSTSGSLLDHLETDETFKGFEIEPFNQKESTVSIHFQAILGSLPNIQQANKEPNWLCALSWHFKEAKDAREHLFKIIKKAVKKYKLTLQAHDFVKKQLMDNILSNLGLIEFVEVDARRSNTRLAISEEVTSRFQNIGINDSFQVSSLQAFLGQITLQSQNLKGKFSLVKSVLVVVGTSSLTLYFAPATNDKERIILDHFFEKQRLVNLDNEYADVRILLDGVFGIRQFLAVTVSFQTSALLDRDIQIMRIFAQLRDLFSFKVYYLSDFPKRRPDSIRIEPACQTLKTSLTVYGK